MSISIKQAFVFVPKDEDWVKKTLMGSLLLFFPSVAYFFPGIRRLIFDPVNYYAIALFFVLASIISMAVCGYFFKSIHNRIVHDETGLPDWNDMLNYIYIGAKAYVGGLVVALPFLLVSGGVLFFAPMTMSVEVLPYALTVLAVHIAYSFLYTMLALNFSLTFSIKNFLNIEKAYTMIHGNMDNFVALVANCLFVALLHVITCLLLMNAHVLALAIPFISFYVFLVYSDLFAQFVLNNKEVKITGEEKCLV